MTRKLLGLTALLLAAAVGFAQDKPKPAGPVAPTPASPDVRDLMFLGEAKPLLIRLHLHLDGKPLPEAFAAFQSKLFHHYDLDGDGTLSKKETERLPGAMGFRNHLMGQGDNYNLEYERATMDEVDAEPKDGKVTPEEVSAYYRKANFKMFSVELNPQRDTATRLTQLLTKSLDRNGDGKLSPEEIGGGMTALRKLDIEEDDSITREELLLWQGQNAYDYEAVARENPQRVNPESPLDTIEPGEPLAPLIAKLLKKFDKDKDLKLSRDEGGLAKELFAKLDADHDDGLDEKELAGWFKESPDLELIVRWSSGKTVGGMLVQPLVGLTKALNPQETLQVFTPADRKPPLNASTAKERETLILTLTDSQTRLSASNSNSQASLGGIKKFYQQAVKRLDTNADGFLDRKEVELAINNDDYFLRGLWAIGDRNGDGKLTETELMAWLDLEAEGATTFCILRIEDQGRGLFEQLDANGDNRLALRELRGGWERLKSRDRDNDGHLGKEETPRLFSMTLQQGQLNHPYFRLTAINLGMRSAGVATKGKGPAWFRKMDRNGDGDLGPREWVGTEEEFRRADADGDGLISLAEAEGMEPRSK